MSHHGPDPRNLKHLLISTWLPAGLTYRERVTSKWTGKFSYKLINWHFGPDIHSFGNRSDSEVTWLKWDNAKEPAHLELPVTPETSAATSSRALTSSKRVGTLSTLLTVTSLVSGRVTHSRCSVNVGWVNKKRRIWICHKKHGPSMYQVKRHVCAGTSLVVQWLTLCSQHRGSRFNPWSRN